MLRIDGEQKRQGRLCLCVVHGDACVFGVDVHVCVFKKLNACIVGKQEAQ